jgi:prepilin-type N-terminal cleavage/methylation domain-containing protein
MAFLIEIGEAILAKRLFSKAQGFTLIEMLIVMAIVALLLTIAVPHYFGSLDKAKDIVLQENLNLLRLTLDKFYADKGNFPDTLEELVEQKYLRAVPLDPITESAHSWILIPARNSNIKGVADVRSGAPGASSNGRLYESF